MSVYVKLIHTNQGDYRHKLIADIGDVLMNFS